MPLVIKVSPIEETKVTDGMLYNRNMDERIFSINLYIAKKALEKGCGLYAIKILNAMCMQSTECLRNTISWVKNDMKSRLKIVDAKFVGCSKLDSIYENVIADRILNKLLHGPYSVRQLVDDDLKISLMELLAAPIIKNQNAVLKKLKQLYLDDPAYKVRKIVGVLAVKLSNKTNNPNICSCVKTYFVNISDEECETICGNTSKDSL